MDITQGEFVKAVRAVIIQKSKNLPKKLTGKDKHMLVRPENEEKVSEGQRRMSSQVERMLCCSEVSGGNPLGFVLCKVLVTCHSSFSDVVNTEVRE